MKVFRDPVHDIIRFDKRKDKLVLELIDSKEMQRLRRIKQLGFSSITYPGAEHSRFAHSLGTAYLMKRVIDHLTKQRGEQEKHWLEEITDNYDLLLCSALLHDIGHGPFSHAIESVTGIKHEKWTMQIINSPNTDVNRILENHKKGFAKDVADVIARVHHSETAVKLLSSQLDVDRFDYLLRDSLMTGAGYGRFDLEWLLHTITIGAVDGIPEVGLDFDKGLSIAEDFVMARYYMYKHVYFHKATRGAEWIAKKILQRVKELVAAKKIKCPKYLDVLFLIDTDKPDQIPNQMRHYLPSYLKLDDNILWYWFHEWAESDDISLRDLSCMILNRKLLKSVDVTDYDITDLMRIMGAIKDEALKLGEHYVHYIDIDTPSTSSYNDPYLSKKPRVNGEKTDGKTAMHLGDKKEAEEQKEASEYIFLFDKQKRYYDLARTSTIINAIREQRLKQQRLYYPGELHDALCKILEGGKNKC